MKSFSFSTTIALVGMMAAITSAVPATSAKRTLLYNVEMLDTSEGGLIARLFTDKNSRTGVQEEEPTPTLAGAVNDAAAVESRLRGATMDQDQASSYGKGMKKGGYGKDCKSKSDKKGNGKGLGKGIKAEGNGKGAKNDKAGGKGLFGKGSIKSPSASPSVSPSASPSVSSFPTVAESESPTDEWCKDDWEPVNWKPGQAKPTKQPTSNTPTRTPGPSISSEPSEQPSISMEPSISSEPSEQPSISMEPSISSFPSDSPSVTSSPSETSSPTKNPVSFGSSKSFCQLYDAAYSEDGTEIDIWNPDLNKPKLEKEATVALASVIDVPVAIAETELYVVEVTMKVIDDKVPDMAIVKSDLDAAITPPVALETVGCPGRARTVAEEYYWENKKDRKLQEDSTLSAIKNWECGEKTNCIENECEVTCNTDVNYQGSLSDEEFEERLFWSLKEYFSMMDDVTDWYPVQTLTENDISITPTDINTNSGGDINGAESGARKSKQGARAAPYIGAATGLLAVLLIMVLFVRRRKSYEEEEVSHLKLEDDFEDDTLYSGSDGARNYNPRDTHIVGETDSVVSHWTGYTGRNRGYEVSNQKSGLMKTDNHDVHQCSSATCEICAESRQKGVTFVKTGGSALPIRTASIPSDTSRGYVIEDTVLL